MGCEGTLSDHGGLFSLDISQHGATAASKALDARAQAAELHGQRLEAFALPQTPSELDILEAVKRFKQVCTSSQGLDYDLLAKLLSETGYVVNKRIPKESCGCKSKTHKCLEKLSHTFLTCTGTFTQSHEKVELIIEPRLREQFEIAQPTASYSCLLHHVPREYVGTAPRLRTIVETVSHAMAEAFKAQEMALPPWRRTSAALSKWNLDKTGDQEKSFLSLKSSNDLAAKQPLTEQLQIDYNRPARGGNVAKCFARAPRSASGTSWQLTCSSASGLENSHEAVKPKISLLARNLADMAAVSKPRRSLEGSLSAKGKIKRAPSWDFSGLPPITTVRRSGKVI